MPESLRTKPITFIFGDLYPKRTGGAEIFNYFLMREIAKKRRVLLIGAEDPKINGTQFFKIKKIKPVRFFYPFQLIIILCKSSLNSSAIYTSFMKASWLIYIPITVFSFFFKVPYSFTIHGGGLMKWKFRLPYLLFFKSANKITGVSDRICNEYKKRTGVNIIYLPPLIPFQTTIFSRNELRIKYNFGFDKKIILFVGSLKPLKNPLLILKAMDLLGKDYLEKSNLFLVYAGDGPLREEIVKFANDHDLSENFKLLGNVSIENIHEIYSLSDYFVICSLFEGTPIALLEAMFHGMPILASDAPGINNLVNHKKTALVFRSEDERELSEVLKQLLEDPEQEIKIKSNAKKYYNEHFNYSKIIDDYIRIINV